MLKRLFLAAAALTGVVANEDFSSLELHGKGLLTIDNINITRVGGVQPFSLSSWFQIHIDNPESASDQMQTLVALRGIEGNEKEMWRFGINTVNILNKTHTSLRLELSLPLTLTSISSPTYIVSLDTPVHVMMTWNGTLTLYVNNVATTYTTNWIQHNITSTTMYIGATGYDSKANGGVGIPILPFVGTITSLSYHHTALSSSDVTFIYNRGQPILNQTSLMILPQSTYPSIMYIFTPSYTSLNYTTGVYTFAPISTSFNYTTGNYTFTPISSAPNATSSGCNELKNSRLEYARVGALYFRCPDEPQVTRAPTTPVPTTSIPTTQAPTTVTPTTTAPTTQTPTTSNPTIIITPTTSTGTTSTPTTSTDTTSTPTTTPTSSSSTGTSTGVSISSSIPSSTTSVTSIDSFSSNNNINGTDDGNSTKSSTGSSTGSSVQSSTGSSTGSTGGSSVFRSSTGIELLSSSTGMTSSPTKPDIIDDIPSSSSSSTGDVILDSSSSTGINNTIAISSATIITSHSMITVAVMVVLAMFL